MKVAAHLVFAAIAAATAHTGYGGGLQSTAASESDCPSVCYDLYEPVCGSDGVTYSNTCYLSVANCNSQTGITQAHGGECAKSETSSYETSTHNSGSAFCSEVCTKIYKPVCGSDGVTYGNDCTLGVAQCKSGGAITKVSDGQCPESSTSYSGSTSTGCPNVCFEIWKPVCGSDGVTYANSCFLGVAHCKNPSITQASDGACIASEGSHEINDTSVDASKEESSTENDASSASSCPSVCIALYAPVCGSDGVTYGNECKLNVASCNHPKQNIKKVSDGACAADCKTSF
ncbi:hypothetical protein PR002_g13425 [Phytophthora rubi]|uniref:Kazal-like domain-containing protein n=1 Tax=Phytophthora rubi TaxID=129364 RepID=A0A6A3LD48_9STRA|nr:hypothetical protein PR002_g13425 [Phytophthora rubi]